MGRMEKRGSLLGDPAWTTKETPVEQQFIAGLFLI